MGVSGWDVSTRLSRRIVGLYAAAERELLANVNKRLQSGRGGGAWREEKLAQVEALRADAQRVVARLSDPTASEARKAVAQAQATGSKAAARELAAIAGLDHAGKIAAPPVGRGPRSIIGIADALTNRLRSTHLRIVRSTDDLFQQIVAEASSTTLVGGSTYQTAARVSFTRLTAKGLTGFTDSRGRNWSLRAYTKMATRTTIAQAATQSHLDGLADAGLDLVIVDDAHDECPLCAPWEGKILTQAGGAGTVLATNPATGRPVQVDVEGSVDEAIGAGLMHPNCRHVLSAYIPGITTPEV